MDKEARIDEHMEEITRLLQRAASGDPVSIFVVGVVHKEVSDGQYEADKIQLLSVNGSAKMARAALELVVRSLDSDDEKDNTIN